ncbi:hypothetical protein [Pyxidicoccus trucidator]|uniref:hypothetical protein n=1 Tax=Pyxidicoccus trucidator TaxID=2709662 RepID=UPI0013DD1E3B|nr:hypothetical protein [Pyxidicoccus trucidator]
MKNRKQLMTTVVMAMVGLTGGLALSTAGGNSLADPACVRQCRLNCAAQYGQGTPEFQECTAICFELCQ